MARALSLFAITAAVGLSASATALAERPTHLTDTAAGTRVLVHYTTLGADAVTPATAAAAAQNGDAAVAGFEALGYPAPLPDGGRGGDDRLDIYLSGAENYASRDAPELRGSGHILLGLSRAGSEFVTAHEVFHVSQFALYAYSASWIAEATADWAAHKIVSDSEGAGGASLASPLDCDEGECGRNDLKRARHPFFGMLAERYGNGIVREVYERAHALAEESGIAHRYGREPLESVLASHGTSLPEQYASFVLLQLGGLQFPDRVIAPSISGPLETQTVTADHLSSHTLAFSTLGRGCPRTTFTLDISVPDGTLAAPLLRVPGGTPQPLPVSAGKATAQFAVNSCEQRALLALPNASTDSDGLVYTVGGSVLLPEVEPDDPGAAPALELQSKPRVKRKRLRLSIWSSGNGELRVRLKPGLKKTLPLRKGKNRYALKLPKKIRRARRTLVLVPVSDEGRAGIKIKRKLRVPR